MVMASKNNASAVEDIQRDVQALRKDLSVLLQQMSSMAEDGGSDLVGKVKDQIRHMQKGLDAAASDAADRGIEALNGISERVTDGIEETFHKHPVSTVAVAAGLGYLFGAVMARR
jgi:ElaB/YqjD/DUF883 family membrane-anchored ribosome-binding protein